MNSQGVTQKQTILKSFAAGYCRRRLRHSSHQASAALLMIEATTSGFDTSTAWLPLLSTTVAPARFAMNS